MPMIRSATINVDGRSVTIDPAVALHVSQGEALVVTLRAMEDGMLRLTLHVDANPPPFETDERVIAWDDHFEAGRPEENRLYKEALAIVRNNLTLSDLDDLQASFT